MDFWTLLLYGCAALFALRLLTALLLQHRKTYRDRRVAEIQKEIDEGKI